MSSAGAASTAIVIALSVVAASCASTETTAAVAYRDAEQVSIRPENLARPTATTATTTIASGFATTATSVISTTTTIPLNDDTSDPVDGVFKAMKIFNGCLSDKGTAFIGLPTAGGDPKAPVNDSGYISDLIECAAVSQIQGAFQELQSASDNIPVDEIEDRNRGLVEWADCLKGRGWKLAALKPDSRGLLQIPRDLSPPAGQTILESDDMQECRDIAVTRLEAGTP